MKSVCPGSTVNEGPPPHVESIDSSLGDIALEGESYRMKEAQERADKKKQALNARRTPPIKKDIRSDDHVDEDHETTRLLGCG
jgi:hypothetical protein